MTATERIWTFVTCLVATLVVVFLATPLVVTILTSFGSSSLFTLPPPSWSVRWYQRLTSVRGLGSTLLVSVEIAALSTFSSIVIGGLASIALVRGRFPGRTAIGTFLTSPLMLPGLVIGIALLQAFRFAGLRDVWTSLLLAHMIVTLPYAVRTIYSSLLLFDFTLVEAARTLGCSPMQAYIRVLIPALAPAFITSGIFAFLASMDNYAVSIFFTDAWTKTLPIMMLNLAEEQPDPTIAAISSLLIGLVLIFLIICDRAIGLRRIVDQH
ncbi:MAG: ABC transporter permease [Rhizobiales bacterium PAR1]|nr:MAG: ABC transporter permease [Rhizobiales bacterium PAR1]